jgi:hypothetical protein
MKRQKTILMISLFSVSILTTLPACFAPARADLVKCGCFCGELTDPPCSEAKCKKVCGVSDGGGRRRQEPEMTIPDPVTERHNRALEMNRYGLEAGYRLDWDKAVRLFAEALTLWPENEEIKKNLADVKKKQKIAQDNKDWIELDRELTGRDKVDREISNLDRELSNRDNIEKFDREISRRDREESIRKREARIAKLREALRVNQQAIRTLGIYDPRDPEKRANDFDAWSRLAEEARLEHEKEFMDDLLWAVEGASAWAVTAKAESLTVGGIKALKGKAKSLGVTDPYLFDAMDALAKTTRKPETFRRLVKRLHVATAAVELTASPTERRATGLDQMDGLGSVLAVLGGKYKLLAAEMRFFTSALYDNATRRVSRASVESLNMLTEQQLKIVTEYYRQMKLCAGEITKEREAIRRLGARS